MPWRRALKNPAFWRIAAIGASYVCTLGFFQYWLQTYLVRGLGLGSAAMFMSTVIVTTNGKAALVFLSLSYACILFQQPNLCAVCLDVGRKNAGAVFAFMNTASSGASAISSVVFGYLVGYFGSYNAPLVPMVGLLCIGAWLWLGIDPTRQLIEEEDSVRIQGVV